MAAPRPEPVTRTEQDTVAAAVRHLIADIGGYTTAEIHPNALLGEDLGYDSLLQLRLIDRLRTKYPQLEAAPVAELLRVIRSVDDLVRFVADRVAGQEVSQ